MDEFLSLWIRLDETTKTTEKVAAIAGYFRAASPADSVWVLSLLTGRRPPAPVRRKLLRTWAQEATNVPEWLFEECYGNTGDLSETIAIMVPNDTSNEQNYALAWWMDFAAKLRKQEELDQRTSILWAWSVLNEASRFLFHKLIGGSFRVGVSRELVVRGLAQATGIAAPTLSHRLMGEWAPTAEFFATLCEPAGDGLRLPSQPYPFCLAHALQNDPEQTLGPPQEYLVEWKWDGIRAQLIRRQGQTFLWSRGEDVIHASFPEVVEAGDLLPEGTVLDGEILVWNQGEPAPFSELQRRLGRKVVGRKLQEEAPCVFMAFDLLEFEGTDWRDRPLRERRRTLESIENLRISSPVVGNTWPDIGRLRQSARDQQAEGLMIKSLDSVYVGGRKQGVWFKWKLAPFTVDAVLIYAQRGTGKRASLYTDYTFGIWSEGQLVPFAKAYSGLTDAEILVVDRFVRNNTQEKFGPVRTVRPELVFEIAFEGIQLSPRHKSGIAVRFPRILRFRRDKKPEDADLLEVIKRLLPGPA